MIFAQTATATATAGQIEQFMSLSDPLIQFLLNIIRALVVLVIALTVARIAKRWVVRTLTRSRVSLNVATLLGNLAQVATVALGIVFILPSFGVDWTGLLTLVGAAGLAISLSMQDLLKNVIAGVYLLMEQPFKIGDRITVKEVTGAVQGIELRTTILTTDDNLQVVVPNSVVLNEIVTNRSATDLKRQALLVKLKGSLSDLTRQIQDALKEFEEVAATPTPTVALRSVESGVANLRVEFWVPTGRRLTITPLVVEALQTRFPEADITVV